MNHKTESNKPNFVVPDVGALAHFIRQISDNRAIDPEAEAEALAQQIVEWLTATAMQNQPPVEVYERDAFLTAYPAFKGDLSVSDESTRDMWLRVWMKSAALPRAIFRA